VIDPLGKVLTEVRDHLVAEGLGDRVRGGEAAPGDAKASGSYNRFVVIFRLDAVPHRNGLPIQTVDLGFRAYGTSWSDAAVVYGAVVDAVHKIGPRLHATADYGIYISAITSGGAASKDPDTQQPFESGVINLIATREPIQVGS
jgi:hypothetical protein